MLCTLCQEINKAAEHEDGNAYVTGFTDSDQTTFPVLVGPDLTANGGSDAFVATCRQQGRNVLDFLTRCCLALGADTPLTSLDLSAE